MIIVHHINGRQLNCRGARLGPWRALLLALRLPFPMLSWSSDDRYWIRPASVGTFQFVSDEVTLERQRVAEKAEAEAEAKRPRMVQVPGMRIPRA